MRRFIAPIAGLVLALTTFVPAAADEPVVINIQMDEATVTAGEPVALEAGWGALTKGLVIAYAHAAQVAWALDGEPLGVTPAWGAAGPFAVNDPLGCYHRPTPTTAWHATSRAVTTFDAPGSHELSVTMSMSHPLTDGGDYDCDGRPDVGMGAFTKTILLTVTEP